MSDNFEHLVDEMKAMVEKYGHADCRFALEIAGFQHEPPSRHFLSNGEHCVVDADESRMLGSLAELYSTKRIHESYHITLSSDPFEVSHVSRNAMLVAYTKAKELCEQKNKLMHIILTLNHGMDQAFMDMFGNPPFSGSVETFVLDSIFFGNFFPWEKMLSFMWESSRQNAISLRVNNCNTSSIRARACDLSYIYAMLERANVSNFVLGDVNLSSGHPSVRWSQDECLRNICSGLECNSKQSVLRSFAIETGCFLEDNLDNDYNVFRDDQIERLLRSLEGSRALEELSIKRASYKSTRIPAVIATTILKNPSSSHLNRLELRMRQYWDRHCGAPELELRREWGEEPEDHGIVVGPVEGLGALTLALGQSNVSHVSIDADRHLDLELLLRLVIEPGGPIKDLKIKCSPTVNGVSGWFHCFPASADINRPFDDHSTISPSKICCLKFEQSPYIELGPSSEDWQSYFDFWVPLISSERLPYLGQLLWLDAYGLSIPDEIKSKNAEFHLWLERNKVGRALLMPSVSNDMPPGFFSVVLEHAARVSWNRKANSLPYDGIYYMIQGLVGGGYMGRRGGEQAYYSEELSLSNKRPRIK